MKRAFPIVLVVAAGVVALSAGSFSRRASPAGRGARQNAAGGVTARTGRAFQGGTAALQAATAPRPTTPATPSAETPQAFKGRTAPGARCGKWSRSADGSATHENGGAYSGANGTGGQLRLRHARARRVGQPTANQHERRRQGRQHLRQHDDDQTGGGVSHSGTCTDASGSVVTCPSRFDGADRPVRVVARGPDDRARQRPPLRVARGHGRHAEALHPRRADPDDVHAGDPRDDGAAIVEGCSTRTSSRARQ